MKPVLRAAVGAAVLAAAIQASDAMADPRYGLRQSLRRDPAAGAGAQAGYPVLVRPPKSDIVIAIERSRWERQEADFQDFVELQERAQLARGASPHPQHADLAARQGRRARGACLAIVLDEVLRREW